MADDNKEEKKEEGKVKEVKEAPVDYDTMTDKQLIESIKANSKELLIIDVRDPDPEDGDYIGGNIKGSVNIPSYDVVDKLPEIITKENLNEKKTVIFTCMMSKGRGPQSYRLYNKARDMLTGDKKDDAKQKGNDAFNEICSTIKLDDEQVNKLKQQKVFVLKGGFHTFLNYHKDEKELIENYNEKYWELTKLEGDNNDGMALYHTNEQ